jgi:hypothetical protein
VIWKKGKEIQNAGKYDFLIFFSNSCLELPSYPHWQDISITSFFWQDCELHFIVIISTAVIFSVDIVRDNESPVGERRNKTKPNMRTQQQRLPSFIPAGSSKVSAQGTRLSKPLNNSLLKVYKINQFLLRSNLGTILMYVPCILYILLSRPSNAKHIFLNNILNTYLRYIKYY